jgi:glyoxylase-like metal-dependent hydrolase (beta-lactamase superfamily II)
MTAVPFTIPPAGNTIYALRLQAGGVLLIDAGPDIDDTWELAVAQAAVHGFAPSEVRTVLITHHHIDHAGLAALWAEAGARILVGAMSYTPPPNNCPLFLNTFC